MKTKFEELPFIANPQDYSSMGGDAGGSISIGKSSWKKDPYGKYKDKAGKGSLGLTPGLGPREKDVVGKFTAELNTFVEDSNDNDKKKPLPKWLRYLKEEYGEV